MDVVMYVFLTSKNSLYRPVDPGNKQSIELLSSVQKQSTIVISAHAFLFGLSQIKKYGQYYQ